ncbi:helix-turn-helix domain-containing protein [Flagellimonas sp. 2504JD4-2]
MDFRAVFNLFLIVGAIQGFVFAFATFAMRRKIEKPILFLNLFVVLLSLNNLQSWLIDKNLLEYENVTAYLTIPWYILIVPAFYTFLLHYLGMERKRSTLLGYGVAFFLLAAAIRFYLIHAVVEQTISIHILERYNLIEDFLTLSYSIYLYVKCISLLKKHRNQYAEILVYDDLTWIVHFLRWGALVFLFWGIAVWINSTTQIIKPPYSYYPLRLTSSILIYWVAYKAFFRYRLLKDRVGLRAVLKSKREKNTVPGQAKNARDKFTFDQFDAFVLENKLFLDPNLSLDKVATELQIGVSTLSKVVNEEQISFSDYINTLRVNESKRILKDPDFEAYTIVAIGLECGFNSKSTFYQAFKKVTGKTPSEYRG